jgi:acyl carrier protein
MSESEVYEFLKIVFSSVFGRNDIVITPELTAHDVVGWDSFRQVEIALALEERYSIRIRAKELSRLTNLGSLVALVVQKASAV